MSDVFITSDEHYGHRNIITFCKRPFANTEAMRESLIYRHNAKVPDNPNILTIHLGDMFWNSVTEDEARYILARLHGSHAFIYGNHDELIERSEVVRRQFRWIVGLNKESGARIIRWNGHEITLNHYAMLTWNRSHKGAWHLFGHSHGELKTQNKSFDVGVDCHNFEPWSMEEIEAEMAKRPLPVLANIWPGKERTNAGEDSGDSRGNWDVALPDPLGDGGSGRA